MLNVDTTPPPISPTPLARAGTIAATMITAAIATARTMSPHERHELVMEAIELSREIVETLRPDLRGRVSARGAFAAWLCALTPAIARCDAPIRQAHTLALSAVAAAVIDDGDPRPTFARVIADALPDHALDALAAVPVAYERELEVCCAESEGLRAEAAA